MTADANLEWKTVTISEVATVNPPRPKYREASDDDLVGFVPMAAVDEVSGTVARIEERSLGELRTKSYRTFAANDVIFAKITPCMENGKAAVVPKLPNGYGFGSTEFHVIRPGEELEAEYVWRFIRQPSFRSAAEAQMTGSVGQLRVPPDFLRASELPLPSVAEQRRVVRYLAEVDGHRGAATAHLVRARTLVAEFRKAVLRAASSGSLTEDWRDTHGRRAWPVLPASEVCEKVQSGGTPKSGFTSEPGIPFLKVYNIVDQQVDFHYRPQYVPRDVHEGSLRKSVALPGDVIMNIVGPPLGKVAIISDDFPEWNLNQAIVIFRPGPRILPEWLYYYLCSGIFMDDENLVTRGSAGQSNISLTQSRNLEVPVPAIDEQREIVRRVERMLRGGSSILERIEGASRLLDRTGNAAVSKVFRGPEIAE